MERRLLRFGDLSVKTASATVTIPIGGGSATASLTLADFNLSYKIEAILHIGVRRQAPIVSDVYSPEGGINAAGNAIGLTLYAGTGTTLSVDAIVAGV